MIKTGDISSLFLPNGPVISRRNTAPRRFSRPVFLVCLIALTAGAVADDWGQLRGPARNGISTEKGWTDKWPTSGPAILWKANVGLGFSGISVAGGKAVTMGNAEEKDTVFCFDALSGNPVWKQSYPAALGDKYFEGGTTGTPTIDKERVYTLSRWGDVFCFELNSGKILWSRNVQTDTGAPLPDWGFSGSPIVYEKLLILNVGEAGMALDKDTGKTVWESAKKAAGYTTPLIAKRAGRQELILGSGQGFLGVDPSTGKEFWRTKWLTQYGVNAADPIVVDDAVFISSGYGKGGALFKPGDNPEFLWQTKILRTQLNGAILYGNHLYGVDGDTSNKATLRCLELATGKEKWADTEHGVRSLIIADGQLILVSERGELMVAPASPDSFKPTAQAQILGGKTWTSPTLANGIVYARNSRGDLVSVDMRSSPVK